MGRDLRYRILYDAADDVDSDGYDQDIHWKDVPNTSRHNEILGYIDKRFTKRELEDYIKAMTHEMRDYDYNMGDLADAIWGLTYIWKQMVLDDWLVRIRYD